MKIPHYHYSDMSVPRNATGHRSRTGTIQNLLKCSEEQNAKGLAAFANSCPDGPHDVGSRVATDQKALNFVEFHPEVTDDTIVDSRQGERKWGTVTTTGAVIPPHKSSDGAATFVDTCLGANAWAVIRGPSTRAHDIRDFSDARQYRVFPLNKANFEELKRNKKWVNKWAWEVLLIDEGTRV